MVRNWNFLENSTVLAIGGTIICVVLNYITDISLITGVWFPLYIISLFIVSVLLSFKYIQWFLRLNKPLKYDLEAIVAKHPYLAFGKRLFPAKKRALYVWKEYDTNELSVISTVLERRLVSSWYVPYVSQEIGFPFACKQMLDQMIEKAFKICNKIETKDVYVDICTIVITHLKEYRKALKRQENCPTSTIESLYHMSHPVSEANTKYTSADHCTNILRILIKELLPWELCDTPHSELLVRILAKRLDAYIDSTLADPAWINDKLMTYLTGEEYVETEVAVQEVIHEAPKTDEENPIVPSVTKSVDVKEEDDPEDIEKMESIVEEQAVNSTPAPDIKSSPVLRQKRGRQGRSEVKIYDRIIEGSVKTWETDMDLQCISMGQDLLASLDGEITLSRLWGQEGEAESSPERGGGKSPQPLWFGEEEALELEPGAREARLSPKAADVLKELHSTVSQAKHKIGDLQDEAAGMMEGLLDFGIAGLKKGLRFTGLSDDSQDKSAPHREKGDRGSPETRHKVYAAELAANPFLQKEGGDNGDGAVPQLVKQHRVTSQDSVPSAAAAWAAAAPDSPEPQYEEAADLSSSIAKLRCLLRQRAEPPHRSEEIWWEGAEETVGRTQHHPSSRPVDTAALADEYDMTLERSSSPTHASHNNMQRLDRLFQRTVTGVFNSLKTAVGGDEEMFPAAGGEWSYVCGAAEVGAGAAAARLQAARRAAAAPVDAALDAAARLPRAPRRRAPPDTVDLEEWERECARAWCASVGAACAARPARHVSVRIATLLLADAAEAIITMWLAELEAWLRAQAFVGAAAAGGARGAAPAAGGARGAAIRPQCIDTTVELLLDKIPALGLLFGAESVREAATLAAHSVGAAPLARHVCYRALDLLALHFKCAAGKRDPSFDNN